MSSLSRRALVGGAFGAGALAAGGRLGPAARAADPPDIIVFLTDDMRASDWEVLGPTRDTLGGTWLPNFRYTTPQCSPSRASLLTGEYPHNNGVRRNTPAWAILRERTAGTLFTGLAAVGYQAVVIGKFLNDYRAGTPIPGVSEPLARTGQPGYEINNTYSTKFFANQAEAAIADAGTAPLFIQIGFNAPHGPSTPARSDRNANVNPVANDQDRQRRRCLLAVNRAVEQVRDAMVQHRGQARWNDAVVVFLSDHGYLFPGDRGSKVRGKGNWYRQITQVPALLRAPGLGAEDGRLCSVIDIAPTLLAAAGTAPDWAVDGRSLLNPNWTRTGVYSDSQAGQRENRANTQYDAILANDSTFVEFRPRKKKRATGYYLDLAERDNQWPELSAEQQQALRDRLLAFKECQGATCRDADKS